MTGARFRSRGASAYVREEYRTRVAQVLLFKFKILSTQGVISRKGVNLASSGAESKLVYSLSTCYLLRSKSTEPSIESEYAG